MHGVVCDDKTKRAKSRGSGSAGVTRVRAAPSTAPGNLDFSEAGPPRSGPSPESSPAAAPPYPSSQATAARINPRITNRITT